MLLNFMRQGAQTRLIKFVLFGILLAAAIGLGLGSSFRSVMPQPDNTVAWVAGDKISVQEFDSNLRRVLSNQGIDAKSAYSFGLVDQMLQNDIAQRLLQKNAHKLGINIGDSIVVEQVNHLIAPFTTGGMSRKTALQRVLMSQGMSEREFVDTIRAEMMNTVLRGALQVGAPAGTDREAADLYQHDNEQRTISGIVLRNDSVTGVPAGTDAVLKPLYEAAREHYAIPETRRFTFAVLSEDTVKKSLTISDEELQKAYKEDIKTYTAPERRLMQQAILPGQADADAVMKAVTAGKTLKDAVKDVTGKTTAYIGEQSFEKAGLLPDIAAQSFTAQKGSYIGPVKTALGYHVLYIKDITPPAVKPFAAVRDAVRDDLMSSRLSDAMMSSANSIDDRLAGGATLETVAKDMNLTLTSYGPVHADGSTADAKDGMKDRPKDRSHILQTAFEMLEGESSPVMELANGSFAVIRVDAVTPKTYKSYDDVKAEIGAQWKQDQQEVLNRQRAQDALKDLLTGKKKLQDLGGENASYVLKRADDPKNPGPVAAAAKDQFFHVSEGDFAMAQVKGGYLVAQVTKIVLPDPAKADAKELKKASDSSAQKTQNEIIGAYLDYLRAQYGARINRPLLDKMYAKAGGQDEDQSESY
jgi:peptidyl-prolyl cis-trans isomerase D